MATYTSTAAQATVQPRMVHAGAIAARGVWSLTASLTDGDIILGPKIPDEAIIDDIRVFIDTAAITGDVAVAIGDGNSRNRFFGTANMSDNALTVRATKNIGYQYLFSDNVDMASVFDTIDVHIGATSGTVTADGHMVIDVTYHMP